MPRSRRSRPRYSRLYLLIASLAFGFTSQYKSLRHLLPSHNTATIRSPFQDECDLSQVTFNLYRNNSKQQQPCNHYTVESSALCWHILVIPHANPSLRLLKLPLSSSSISSSNNHHILLPSELKLLRRLHGCVTPASCAASVPCSYGIEDPSDAFWLRSYKNSSKFVVLFNVGLATLMYFILAVVVDGSMFNPHRDGLALSSASALTLLAIAALLYVLVVPYHLQFSLWGAGTFNTLAYLLVVMVIAASLPALAVVWLSCVVFIIFFLGFLFEHVFVVILATCHFIIVFLAYQIEHTALHVRLVYFSDDLSPSNASAAATTATATGDRDGNNNDNNNNNGIEDGNNNVNDGAVDDVEIDTEAEYDARVLAMGVTFMRRIRSNWFIARIPRLIEERALQITQNNMPDHVHEQLFRDQVVPQVSAIDVFDDVNNNNNNDNNSNNASSNRIPTNQQHSDSYSSATPILTTQTHRRNHNSNVNEATPLLHADTIGP